VSEMARPGEPQGNRQRDLNAEPDHVAAALDRIWPEEPCCSAFIYRHKE
jgi:hypothetical protein